MYSAEITVKLAELFLQYKLSCPHPPFFFSNEHGFIDLFIFKGAVTCCFDYLLNYLQLEEIANSLFG